MGLWEDKSSNTFRLCADNISTSEELKFSLNKFVELTAQESEVCIDKELLLSMKFAQLIEKAHEKAGRVCDI
jgi:hypothetical protein